MKKIIFALLLVNALWPSLSFGQYDSLQASVYYLTLNKTTYCRVTLADSGLVKIELIDFYAEGVIIHPIFCGHYKTTDSGLVLRDSIQQYTMVAHFTSIGKLRFTKAFGFMLQKNFRNQHDETFIQDDITYLMSALRTPEYFQLARDEYQKHTTENLPFIPGTFQHIVNGRIREAPEGYTLRFIDSRYALSRFEVPLSRGTWERQHNLIRLHDEDVDHDFWVGIAPGNQLISMLLPTNFGVDTTIWKNPHAETYIRIGK